MGDNYEGRSDKYVWVQAILIVCRQDAFYVECDVEGDAGSSNLQWIPYSLVPYVDEKNITNEHQTEIIKFRVREWKAKQANMEII